jgi:hypothetical protein
VQKPDEIHGAVIDRLKELDLDGIADKLFQLRRWRNWSDYDLNRTIGQGLAKKAYSLAIDIYSLIQQELS